MTNVLVTGGAGFLGARLARQLLAAPALPVAGRGDQPVARLTLADQAPVPPDLARDERVTVLQGDLAGLVGDGGAGQAALAGADVVFPPGRRGQRGMRGGLRPGPAG